MNELKTLKDIKGIFSNGNKELGELHTNTEELKQEAIKWIKELEKEWDRIRTNPEDYVKFIEQLHINGGVVGDYLSQRAGQSNWIRHFFNIEESDLK